MLGMYYTSSVSLLLWLYSCVVVFGLDHDGGDSRSTTTWLQQQWPPRFPRAVNLSSSSSSSSRSSDEIEIKEDVPIQNKRVVYRVKEFPINCNLGKIKMEEFSYGCKECTCKNNSVECLKDVMNCEFGDDCYRNKETWTHKSKNCSCNIGYVMCLPIFPREQGEPTEYRDDAFAKTTTAGYIPLNFEYTSPLLVLEWQTPIKPVILYELCFTKVRREADELVRTTRSTSLQLLYDLYQQVRIIMSGNRRRRKREVAMMPAHMDWKRSWKKKFVSNKGNPHPYLVISNNNSYWHRGGCFSKYRAELRPSDLNVTYANNKTSKVAINIMPCLDEIYYVVLIAHLHDRCPEWEPDNCKDYIDFCSTDSDCPVDQVCCSISNCGQGCVEPDHYGRTKKTSSRIKVLDLTEISGRSFFGSGAAQTQLCLILTFFTFVINYFQTFMN